MIAVEGSAHRSIDTHRSQAMTHTHTRTCTHHLPTRLEFDVVDLLKSGVGDTLYFCPRDAAVVWAMFASVAVRRFSATPESLQGLLGGGAFTAATIDRLFQVVKVRSEPVGCSIGIDIRCVKGELTRLIGSMIGTYVHTAGGMRERRKGGGRPQAREILGALLGPRRLRHGRGHPLPLQTRRCGRGRHNLGRRHQGVWCVLGLGSMGRGTTRMGRFEIQRL